jgi:hypothetical protein
VAEIIGINGKRPDDAPAAPKQTALEKGFAKALEQFPGCTSLVMIMYDDNGNMACVEVNIDTKEMALAAIRLAHITNRAMDGE